MRSEYIGHEFWMKEPRNRREKRSQLIVADLMQRRKKRKEKREMDNVSASDTSL